MKTITHIGPGKMHPELSQRISTFIRHQSDILQGWTPELLNLCRLSLIEDGPYLVAVVWYHETDDLYPRSWMIHVAAAEAHRKRWLSLRIIGECLSLPFEHGASRLYAHVTSDYVARIWAKLGFHLENHQDEGPMMYKDAEEWDLKLS